MGENAIDIGNNGKQFLHTPTYEDIPVKFVAFQGTGSTEPPPLTGITESRLGVVYFGQTNSETEITIYMEDETLVSMETPDADIYYFSKTDPIQIQSLNLPPGVYTTFWSGSTAGATWQNGAATSVTNLDNGLTQTSHMFSCVTTSGNPPSTISSGTWTFNIRSRTNDAIGNDTIDWYVYKSEIIDAGQTNKFYSNDTYLFSGTTDTLTTSFVNYSIDIDYGSTIVFP